MARFLDDIDMTEQPGSGNYIMVHFLWDERHRVSAGDFFYKQHLITREIGQRWTWSKVQNTFSDHIDPRMRMHFEVDMLTIPGSRADWNQQQAGAADSSHSRTS